MKVLALDFDGVISDSAPECFWIALRTLLRVRPNTGYQALLASLDELDGAQAREAVARDSLYRGFLELLPLGNRAEDFGVALLALAAGVKLETQAEYDHYYDSLEATFAADFHSQFYRERDEFSSAQPERWALLMSPYRELIEALRRHAGSVDFAIATAKDGASVSQLLSHYQLEDLLGPDHVFDKEAGRDKRAHLGAVRERFDVDFSEITFIDDKVNHLIPVQELGVRCFLASWGYNGPREHVLAQKNGIGVCGLDQLESMVFS